MQIHAPTVVPGGVEGGGGGGGSSVGGTRARVFDMFQYFETILPAVESL